MYVTDALGKVVHTGAFSVYAGTNVIPLNMEGERAGIYFLTIADDAGVVKVISLIKK